MTDSRRNRALTAARIRLRSPIPRPLLDETRIDEVCAELLELEEDAEIANDEYAEARRVSAGRIARAWLFTCFWLAVATFGGFLSGQFVERMEHQCRVSP